MATRRGRRSALTPSQQLMQQWSMLTKTTSAQSSGGSPLPSPGGSSTAGSRGKSSSARLAAQLRNLQDEIDSPKTLLSALDAPSPAARVKALKEEAALDKIEAEQAAAALAAVEEEDDGSAGAAGGRGRQATGLLPEVREVAEEVGEDLRALAEQQEKARHNQRLLDEMRRGVVLYDYYQTWKSTIEVRKGDHVTILDVGTDPKWWLVTSESGAQGWLPKQFVRHSPWANPAHISTVTAALP
jgi:hypothetical protein